MFEKIGNLEYINAELGDILNALKLLQECLVSDMRTTEHEKVAAMCLYRRMPMYQSSLNVIETMLDRVNEKSDALATDMYEECK